MPTAKQTEQEAAQSLFSSYRVLDLTDEKGLFCGKILGDIGMDVIKIERPGGDPARWRGPFYHDTPDTDKSLFWFASNTSKRGITLNIESADGQQIFRRLVKGAHFVIESFAPGYMDGLGLGYSALKELNPNIILTSITPFGQSGPYREYKSCDIVAMALGGLMNVCGDADRAPIRCTIEQTYFLAGIHAAVGSMIAHHYRETTGEGQQIDVSMCESVTVCTTMDQPYWEMVQFIMPRMGSRRLRGAVPMREVWQCRDGFICWRFTAGVISDAANLVAWMDNEGKGNGLEKMDWAKVDIRRMTQQEVDSLENTFAEFFLTHTKDELYKQAVERRVFLLPANTPRDMLADTQLAARKYWVEVDHPELGAHITYPGDPVRMSHTVWGIRRRAPLIGEHNNEIYHKELEISKHNLIILKENGVI